jgi:Tfp pilus assembly protein PilF
MSANSNLSQPQPESQSKISVRAREQANRHFLRAQEQLKLRNATLAVQELRDAIKIDPKNSEYHAFLAKIHLDQGLVGMANISLRQALKFNPNDPLALECMERLKTQSVAQKQPEANSLSDRIRSFLTMKL